jgi:hypothetical protein
MTVATQTPLIILLSRATTDHQVIPPFFSVFRTSHSIEIPASASSGRVQRTIQSQIHNIEQPKLAGVNHA